MIEIKSRIDNEQPQGVAIVCDPHQTSVPPSSRQDKYTEVVNKKMESVIGLCNEMNLVPLICGDLFHRPTDNSQAIINTMIDLFYTSKFSPLIIPGNHDLSSKELSRKDSLYTIKSSRAAIVSAHSGPIAYFKMQNSQIVAVGGTPYGQEIPTLVDWPVNYDIAMWMTHHNLPFSSCYKEQFTPPFKAISGVHEVFNGHLHHEAMDVTKDNTVFHNFGSISRTKRDESERTPLFTIWTENQSFETVELKTSTTDLAFKSGGRQQASESIIREAGESGKRFVDFLSNSSHANLDLDGEFDKMFKSGSIDRDIYSMLLELSSIAQKENTK